MNQPTKEVNIAKNLTDALAIVAAVFAFAAILIARKKFEPDEAKGLLTFLDVETTRIALRVGVSFLFSGVFCAVTRRIPPLGCPVSLIPTIVVIDAFKENVLAFDNHPTVYIILGAVHFVGSLIYLCQWFTEDPRQSVKNSVICWISGFLSLAFALAVFFYGELHGFTGFAAYAAPTFKTFSIASSLFGILGVIWFVLSDKKKLSTLWCSSAAAVAAPLFGIVKIFLT